MEGLGRVWSLRMKSGVENVECSVKIQNFTIWGLDLAGLAGSL